MYFKPYYLGCLSHASYLVASSVTGEAAVIDPRRDVDEYLADAAALGLSIRHVIETHLHADFVSGHLELAARAGATVYLGAGSGAAFAHHPIREGDTLALGADVTLHFLATPGHTPESVCVLAEPCDACRAAEPTRLFSGDTLFIGDVGRPDLANGAAGLTPETMAAQLFRSLRDAVLPLPDGTEIWPAHGAGSSCGKALSDERVSTLGKQKRENIALGYVLRGDEAGFVRYATEGLGDAPRYFGHDVSANRAGAGSLADVIARAKPLSPALVEEFGESGGIVIDGRDAAAFGAAHVPGALNIPLAGRFAPFVGLVVSPDAPLVVVADAGQEAEAITRLARVGYENVAGFLAGGMDAWRDAGGETGSVAQWSAKDLARKVEAGDGSFALLDVRTAEEWDAGHTAGACHIPLAELGERLGEVPAAALAVMCGSGYRSAIAASLLARAGRRGIANIVGGWSAYKAGIGG